MCTFAPSFSQAILAKSIPSAQMAELVDALVSNTNAARRPGSTPGLGTTNYLESVVNQVFTTLFVFVASKKNEQITAQRIYLIGKSAEPLFPSCKCLELLEIQKARVPSRT